MYEKNLKRIVSVFLTLTIVLSMFSLCFVTSGALTTDDQTEETNVFELGDQETLCSPKSSECDHFCHSTNGFISFLYKIFSFFWKLFEINKYCQCGTAHYGLVTINLDSDANGIPDCIDNNDYATDTDGDGLSDYQEYIYCCTDPLVVDTDGDGKNDADSDTDNDTLSNKYELSIGTNPASEDTDDDYLNDADELAAKTDPLIADTDGDGAKDGWELQNGYDPLVYDSSFSVVAMAYNESESNDIGASVCVDVDGEQTDTIKVRPVNENENALISNSIAGYMGTAYDFTMDGTFDEATLEFTYDSSLGEIGEDFQPRIYYLNEEDGVFEELPEQTVEDGKVTAVTTHFSTYILLNKAEFDKIWNDEIKSPIVDSQGRQSGIDVVFALDVSNSMNSYSRLSTAKTALNAFLDALDDNDRAALVKFNTTSTTVSGLTDNISSVKSVVSSITASGNTSMYNGLSNAIDILSQDMDYGYKLIIILSDGSDVPSVSYDSYYSPLVNKAIANDITIYTVGAGTSVSTSVLTNIANETGGSYYAATATSSIIDAFGYVKSDTVDVKTDSNNDGIPDYYAELIKNGEMVLSNGSLALKGVDLNASDDIDNDGLKNGEEVVVVENNGRVYLKYESSPIKADTENDGIPDFEDTAPLTKGDVNGYIGTLHLISCGENSASAIALSQFGIGNASTGHTFLIYTSDVNDELNVKEFNKILYKNNNDWYAADGVELELYHIDRGCSISLGANGLEDWVTDGNTYGAFCATINVEVFKFSYGVTYSPNSECSRKVTQNDLDDLIEYFSVESGKKYSPITHQCAHVATGAWNALFDVDIDPIGLNTPKAIKKAIENIGGNNIPLSSFVMQELN